MGLRLVSDTTTPAAVPDTPEVRKVAHILRAGCTSAEDRVRQVNRSQTYGAAGLRPEQGRPAFDALVAAEVLLLQEPAAGRRPAVYYLTDRLWQLPEPSLIERGEIVRWHLRAPSMRQRELDLQDPVFGAERRQWVLEAFIGGQLQPRAGEAVPW